MIAFSSRANSKALRSSPERSCIDSKSSTKRSLSYSSRHASVMSFFSVRQSFQRASTLLEYSVTDRIRWSLRRALGHSQADLFGNWGSYQSS